MCNRFTEPRAGETITLLLVLQQLLNAYIISGFPAAIAQVAGPSLAPFRRNT